MAEIVPSETISKLNELSGNDGLKSRLAIIRISEPIFSEVQLEDAMPSNRGSDASSTFGNNPTPSSLETDLTHYKV